MKQAAIDKLAADVMVVPESPKPPAESTARLWFGEPDKKGLAVMAGPGVGLELVDVGVDLPRYVIPIQVRSARSFLLLAVWTQNDGDDRYVRGLVRAVDACESLISSQDTVIMGDFNSSTRFDKEHPKDRNHSALVRKLDSLGLESAYHAHYVEGQGAETRPTFFHHYDKDKPHHIDFCFLPKSWRGSLKSVAVGSFAEWKEYSDHAPLMVDIADVGG